MLESRKCYLEEFFKRYFSRCTFPYTPPPLSLSLSIYIYHHHDVVQPARISLTLSLHVFLSFIASGRSSGLHPVSSHSCCMYVRAGRPAFDWPYAGVHRSTSLTSSSLLLQQCPACLVRLAWIVFVIGGRSVPCGVLLPGLVQYCSQHIYIYTEDNYKV